MRKQLKKFLVLILCVSMGLNSVSLESFANENRSVEITENLSDEDILSSVSSNDESEERRNIP